MLGTWRDLQYIFAVIYETRSISIAELDQCLVDALRAQESKKVCVFSLNLDHLKNHAESGSILSTMEIMRIIDYI